MIGEMSYEKTLHRLGLYRRFDDVLWASHKQALSELGLHLISKVRLVEVDRNEAIKRLTDCLANDLCYGVKNLGKEHSKKVATEFIKSFHDQSRFYTNSNTGYTADSNAWSFSPLSENSTMDTGIIVRTGKELTGIMWVFSSD